VLLSDAVKSGEENDSSDSECKMSIGIFWSDDNAEYISDDEDIPKLPVFPHQPTSSGSTFSQEKCSPK
jgi:hypothetical protein